MELLRAQLVLPEQHHQLEHRRAHKHKQAVRKDPTTLQPDLRALYAWPAHILIQLALVSAQNVLSDRHHQLAHRHAHPVRQGRTRVLLDRRHARSVLSDRHRQLAHRHAHHAHLEHTPRRPDQCAHHARQGRMLALLDRRSARNAREDHHRQLVHRRAHPVRRDPTLQKRGRYAHLVVPGHTRIALDQ
jgi:hypothetical protein